MVSDDYPILQTIIDECRRSIRTAMAIDNGGTKNNQGLLRFQSGLGIYGSNIYSDLVICSLVSCSYHVAVCLLGLVLSFSHRTSFCYLATSPGQKESNGINEPLRGEVILMLGCVKMAYLYVPSRDRSRNVEETSASEALPCTIVRTPL